MLNQAARFAGDIPSHYDSGLGRHLFVDYAADIAQRVAAAKPGRVLEIAAGTGIVTRMLRDALPPSTRLVASDLNPAMLKIARQKFGEPETVEFYPADAIDLPFADGAFDAVVCQFGLMFFPDKDKAHREAFRVLASGAHYHFSVWDSFEFNSFARIAHETVGRFFGQDAPSFFTIPFGYYRVDAIKASLLGAGFDDISVRVMKNHTSSVDTRSLAEGLILGSPIIEEIGARGIADPATITAAVAEALQHEFGHDPGRMTLQAIVFRARKT